MTKKKLAIIAASSMSVMMVVALTVGIVYKMNKAAEYERYLAGQEQAQQLERERLSAEKAAAEALKKPVPPIVCETNPKENTNPPPIAPPKATTSAKDTQSAPQITVSIDEKGNQTITPEWEKPAPPPEKELHNPESKPETPKKPDKNTDPDIKLDDNGDQIPNAKGEVYVPGFGWMKPTGGKSETADFELSGNLVGY